MSTAPIGRQAFGILVAAVLVSACGASTPTSAPNESIPPAPAAPSGWRSVVAFGGTGGTGFVGVSNIALRGRAVAVNAACSGTGTLIVLLGTAEEGDSGARPAAVFPCALGGTAATRVELTGMPIPQVAMLRATVVEGLGTLRHAAFNVSVEQEQ